MGLTPMIAPAMEDEQVLNFIRESTPLGCLARSGETARVALFLASDEASYIKRRHPAGRRHGWTAR